MADKRKRTLGKSKCCKQAFVVSLNSRKCKGITTNSQIQIRLEPLLQKHDKVGKS